MNLRVERIGWEQAGTEVEQMRGQHPKRSIRDFGITERKPWELTPFEIGILETNLV